MISGTPQTRQKVVLAKTLLKRCGVVPPPFNLGLAMVTLIQATIARSASAPMTISQKVRLDQITLAKCQPREELPWVFTRFCSSWPHVGKSQSLNHDLFDLALFPSLRYHAGLRSYAPLRLISKIRGCHERIRFFRFHSARRDQRADVHRRLIIVAKRRDVHSLDVSLRQRAAVWGCDD